jgi:hypothetical protein
MELNVKPIGDREGELNTEYTLYTRSGKEPMRK